MPIGYWNDDEDAALQGLSAEAQVIYLRGIRRFADRRGMAGIARRINRKSLSEVCHYLPDRGSRRSEVLLTWNEVRARLAELERAGLLVPRGEMVFYLPFADEEPIRPNEERSMNARFERTLERSEKSAQSDDFIENKSYQQSDERTLDGVDERTTSPVTINNNNINTREKISVDQWVPSESVYLTLQFDHSVHEEFAKSQLIEFRLYWHGRGNRDDWDSLFIKRCIVQWNGYGSKWAWNNAERLLEN